MELRPATRSSIKDHNPRVHGTLDRNSPLETELAVRILSTMLRARVVDDKMLKLQRQGRISFHVGYRGEEAAIIAATAALRATDWVFPCYRELGALLWRGFSLQAYVDNMFGNEDDAAQGRQMPDHLTSRAHCYASVSSPIGTQITHAVGLSWAAKLRGDDVVAAAFFGEGGTSSSDFHSALNFAGTYKTPTLFLCRNNGWAISTPARQQTTSDGFSIKAAAYGMQGVCCDGNDAAEVYQTVRDAAERARRGKGPTLIELVTYRLGGHSTSDDPTVYRSDDQVQDWQHKDPIVSLSARLAELGVWSDAAEQRLTDEVERELAECIKRGENKPPPPLESLVEDVFEECPWHLRQQLAELVTGPRPRRAH
jgi:pyruvate dehydrogenase E1 component alpha subunit